MIKPKKTLENIEAYLIDKYYQTFEMKLDSNENPYGCSPLVLQAIRNFDPEKISHYPAYGELADKMAELFGAAPENFIFTNGCDEAINVVFNTYLEKDDEVLSYAPTFSMPKLYADCIGAKFQEIPYIEKFRFDLENFAKNISDKTKILYITSPNNPTGEVIDVLDAEKIIQNNPNRLVVLDCTYFNYSEFLYSSYYELVKKYNNFVIVKSLSKDYATAGLRLGYIFSNENITKEIRKVISPYSVNSAALVAGLAALSDREYFLNVKQKLSLSKEKLVSALKNSGFEVYKTKANFILVDCGKFADFIYNKLLSLGVKIKYFKSGEMKGMFRITVPKLEDVEKLISYFKPRPLFVFDLDGVVFDVKNSYRLAIQKTFERYTGSMCSDFDIQNVKNMGNMSNDWDVTHFLLQKAGKNVDYNEMVNVFQDLFFKPENKGQKGLIDNEKNVLDKEFFEKLTRYADCAVFTGRPREEAFYSLEKFGIKKYFSYFICNEDVEGNYKPSPFGLNKIKENCLYSNIFYFGDTVDDIKAGVDASVKAFGIIPPNAENVEDTKEKMKNMGAKGVIENKNEIFDMVTEAVYAGG